MKSTEIKIAFVLILNAAFAILSLTCCREDTPDTMRWNVSTENQDNIEATYDSSRRPQIEIIVGAEGGQCTLSCANYEHISFREKSFHTNIHQDLDCDFHAKIINQGVITIRFDKMNPNDNDVTSYFIIDGEDGDDINTTVVKVTRVLHGNENFQ